MNIVWFKRDLRLSDHAPLKAAIEDGESFLMLYIWGAFGHDRPTL